MKTLSKGVVNIIKHYTLGEVIDLLKPEELAIKIDGETGVIVEGYECLDFAVHFDSDGILKSYPDNYELTIYKATDAQVDKYIIVDKESIEI